MDSASKYSPYARSIILEREKKSLVQKVKLYQGIGHIYFIPKAELEIKALGELWFNGRVFDSESKLGKRRAELVDKVRKNSLKGDTPGIINLAIKLEGRDKV
tara:strand:+ start:86 stop:391 length:306 start_codon:yes stop_codon:yes gene_type:complete